MSKYFWVAISLVCVWGILRQVRYWREPPPLTQLQLVRGQNWIVPRDMYRGDWMLVVPPMTCQGPKMFNTDFNLYVNGLKSPETRVLNPYMAYARMP